MSKILSHKRAWIRSVFVACLFVLLAPLSASAEPYGGGGSKSDDYLSNLKRANSMRWDGGWFGVNGGAGWGTSQFIETVSSDRYGINGGLFGVSGAYIRQFEASRWYGGVDVDYDWANVRGTASQNCIGCETKVTSFGTLRGVLAYGYPMGSYNCYPYITGGLAFGNAQANVPGFPGASEFKTGWTVGAGAELQINKLWSVKAEYLYSDLGSLDCTTGTCGGNANIPVKLNIVRTGLNYKFLPQ